MPFPSSSTILCSLFSVLYSLFSILYSFSLSLSLIPSKLLSLYSVNYLTIHCLLYDAFTICFFNPIEWALGSSFPFLFSFQFIQYAWFIKRASIIYFSFYFKEYNIFMFYLIILFRLCFLHIHIFLLLLLIIILGFYVNLVVSFCP